MVDLETGLVEEGVDWDIEEVDWVVGLDTGEVERVVE